MTAVRRVARPGVLGRIPLDRCAVIEASAGTGKTFTLEHLVVELLLTTDVTIDRILVVTFTEKATNELRLRLRAKLEELRAPGVDSPTIEAGEAGEFWEIDEAARERLDLSDHGRLHPHRIRCRDARAGARGADPRGSRRRAMHVGDRGAGLRPAAL